MTDVGAANTVVFGGVEDDWWGANTDVPGLVAALRSAGVSRVTDAVVLGGGATAASALAALRDMGAASPRVLVRRPDAVGELMAAAARLGVSPAVRPLTELADVSAETFAPVGRDVSAETPVLVGRDVSAETPVLVSTLPAGAADALVSMLPEQVRGLLFDVVYAPWPTALANAWQQRGGRVAGGLELLVEQAALQVRLMTGLEPPVDVMRAAGRAALSPPA